LTADSRIVASLLFLCDRNSIRRGVSFAEN
jgi:hypothetical protein